MVGITKYRSLLLPSFTFTYLPRQPTFKNTSADKNVFWWMASVNYSGLALVSLVVQNFRFQSLSKKVRWYDIPAWWVLLPLAIISAFMLAGGVLLIPFIQIGCLVCILLICCNMRATCFNSITLGLSVFLLARFLWALAFQKYRQEL